MIEQVSLHLKPMVIDNIPLGDRLTIGQIIQIYQMALCGRRGPEGL